MHDPNSRYFHTPTLRYEGANGVVVAHKERRFLPSPGAFQLAGQVVTEPGDRPDLLAARTLGDPRAAHHLCDAQAVMHPQDLVAEVGLVVAVPMPMGHEAT